MAEEEEVRILPAQLHLEYCPPEFNASRPAGDPPYHGEAAVDIIAVHGLASKYHRTWSIKQPDGSRYNWLSEQLPKDMPDARILGFEYASNWYDNPVVTRLSECGRQLLNCIVQDRSHVGSERLCPSRRRRPIILIGHSFGGLVIKQALILASQTPAYSSNPEELAAYENHRDILASLAGIVFLGTPHRGSGFSILADVKLAFGDLRSTLWGQKPSKELISILHVDSLMVIYIQDEFHRLCGDARLSNLSLYCYYEMRQLLIPPRLVVDADSACLDNAFCRGMDANHMELNKFHGPDDHNYRHVLADLQAVFYQSVRSVATHFETWKYGAMKQNSDRDRLQRWLDPSRGPQTTNFAKKLESHKMAAYTCQWLQNLEDYQLWSSASPLENVMWINGKAGSGKSVLAAFVIDQLRSAGLGEPATVCSKQLRDHQCGYKRYQSSILYFFCGVDRARESPEQILGTLIHQLLLAHSENEEMFQMALQLENTTTNEEYPRWQALVDRFLDMVNLAGKVFIVIDGLEENPRWYRCLQALSRLSAHPEVRILVSSQATIEIAREWPAMFPNSKEILITDHSHQDISQFSRNKIADLVAKKPALAPKEGVIFDSVMDGSQGMFQWVNYALLHVEEDVEDPDDVEESFKGLPSELRSTWERVFARCARKEDPERDENIRTALKLLAVSGRPVSLAEIKAAIYLTRDEKDPTRPILDPGKAQSHAEIAESEIPLLLGSLIDISHEDMTAQLAHSSLLAALTSSEVSRSSKHTAKYSFTIEEAHRQTAELCMLLCQNSTFAHANSFAACRLPFVEYAWDYWAYHLNLANPTRDWGQPVKDKFNNMVFSISRDVLSYLDALCQFLGKPLKAVPGRFSDREYVLALQRAQDSLSHPIADLTLLRKQFGKKQRGIFDELENTYLALPSPAFQIPGSRSLLGSINQTSQVINDTVKSFTEIKTAVTRIRLDEAFEKHPHLIRPKGPAKNMLDAARHLRILALRLAVDPVYSALILSAGGQSFSPLHVIIYSAQLFEQSGSFPYWFKSSPYSNLVECFSCPPEDPEFATAKFVLQCFEWRVRRRTATSESLVGRYIRINRIHAVEPNPSGRQLLRVSTENEKQVKRLHNMSGKQYYQALVTYGAFAPKDDWAKLIANPLAGLHMKKSLMLDEHDDALLFHDPAEVMHIYVPEEVEETPMTQYLIAVPRIMQVYFVRFVAAILEVFGRISKQVLATHFARLQVAIFEFAWVVGFMSRFRSQDPETRLRLWYLVPGLFLFWLRCRYVPTFGAYHTPHTWTQFIWAWKHPAAYLDLQNVSGFLMWLGTVLRVAFYNGVGQVALTWGISVGEDDPAGMAANVYGVFHAACTAERSIFGVATSIATLVSCALVIMNDPASMRDIFKVSIFYWFNAFFSLFMGAVQTGAVQSGAGVAAVFITSLLHVAMVIVFIFQYERIARWGAFLLLPVTAPLMFVWRTFLVYHVLLARLTGVAAMLALVGVAVFWAHKWIWDPYEIDKSLSRLYGASRLARSTLYPTDFRKIGEAPFGDATALQLEQEQACEDEKAQQKSDAQKAAGAQQTGAQQTGAPQAGTQQTGAAPAAAPKPLKKTPEERRRDAQAELEAQLKKGPPKDSEGIKGFVARPAKLVGRTLTAAVAGMPDAKPKED